MAHAARAPSYAAHITPVCERVHNAPTTPLLLPRFRAALELAAAQPESCPRKSSAYNAGENPKCPAKELLLRDLQSHSSCTATSLQSTLPSQHTHKSHNLHPDNPYSHSIVPRPSPIASNLAPSWHTGRTVTVRAAATVPCAEPRHVSTTIDFTGRPTSCDKRSLANQTPSFFASISRHTGHCRGVDTAPRLAIAQTHKPVLSARRGCLVHDDSCRLLVVTIDQRHGDFRKSYLALT